MIKVKVLRPISVGGAVFQKGEIVELNEDIVAAHGADYVEEVSEEVEATADAPQEVDESTEAEPKKKASKNGKK